LIFHFYCAQSGFLNCTEFGGTGKHELLKFPKYCFKNGIWQTSNLIFSHTFACCKKGSSTWKTEA